MTRERQNQKWRHNTKEVLLQLTVEACPIHHTVKQLTMTLNALLASPENAFGVHAHMHTHTHRGAMKSLKGGMQDRNVGPLLPEMCACVRPCVCLTFNKKLKDTE